MPRAPMLPLAVLCSLAVLTAACRPARTTPRPDPTPATNAGAAPTTPSAAPSAPTAAKNTPAAPPAPPVLERLRVPGNLAASVVRAEAGAPPSTVFVPGICSNASYYLNEFREAAKNQGGVVAVEGDQPCNGEAYRSFSWDAAKLHARIEAAIAAAGLHAVPPGGLTLVGYSQGAALAEQLAQRWPERYTRLVLIGAPKDPVARNMAQAQGVVTMACSRDVTARMRAASDRLQRAGVPSTYVEMPGCSHGQLAEPERVFAETFGFLRDNARPTPDDAAPVTLVGTL